MGFFKSIGKFFKKVTKVVAKVAPIALAIGAAVFTGGAALGLGAFAGGWGAAAGSFASSLGLTGTLGSVVTGAITQAGYGALAGGALSLVTGGDPIKGMQGGALTGAVTGGVLGGLGMATDPLAGIGSNNAASPVAASAGAGDAAATGFQTSGGFDSAMGLRPVANVATDGAANVGTVGSGPAQLSFKPTTQAINTGFDAAAAGARGPLVSAAAPTTAPPPTAGPNVGVTPTGASASAVAPGMGPPAGSPGGPGGWLERNQLLAGNVISGLGKGLLGGSEVEDLQELDRERYARVADSYSTAGTSGYDRRDDAARPTPAQKYGSRRRYTYDRNRREIV